MENKTVSKRKKDKQSDNEDDRRDKKATRKHRSRSRSREDRNSDNRRKRRHSRSRSPNVPVKQEKRREDAPTDSNANKNVPERKAKETDMLNTRTGGAYIPPARLRMMQAQITDKSSVAYQRLAWEALKKSIHGHINKINVGNIGIIIKELLKENIVRGRGLLCRSVIQAQAASPTFTNVYAALVAAVNSRFPNIGELLLKRLVIQFKRGFKRNDKPTCISSASFIAHLVNQRVAHEILALELLTLLVESPTDDSVEVAIAFLKECGQKLTEVSTKGVNAIFEMLRNILHEGQLDKRVQYMIEVMFQVWKDGFKDHPALIEELELVPEEEQFTHLLMLDDATDPQDILNVFKFDDKYEENEQKYKTLSKEILGSDAESGDEDGSEESGSEETEDEEQQEGEQKGMTIIDNTETNLVALRRTIYLTINSSLDFEECAHKLMKMQLKPGQEVELCHMFLDCCAEQRTYEKFYGLLAQRFCNINRIYIGPFEEIFKDSYSTAHRLDTNRLRNVSKFFAHLLFTDSISWEVMECVKLNEEDTTSSSRIYIKILFQELAEYMGLKKLNDRLKDPTLQDAFSGIFPRDNPKNTRFSINFFTSIGLGGLTDELREHLKQMPKNIPAPVTDINVESSSSSSSSSDSSSESSSSSDSEEDNEKKNKNNKKSSEKRKSKQSNDNVQAEAAIAEKSDKNQRWGHDGFYETYGDSAQRHENRLERSRQNNFPRPRDREAHQDDLRENRDERNNRDRNGRRKDRNTLNSDKSRDKTGSENKRQDRELPADRRSDNTENGINERNKKDSSRYEKGRSDREEKRRDEDFGSKRDNRVDDRKQDRGHRRGRDYNSNRDDTERDKSDYTRERNDRTRVNEPNGDDDRNRNRNFEREKKDKDHDRNYRSQEDRYDRYKNDDRNRERISEHEKRERGTERNERVRENDINKNNDRLERENRNKERGKDDRDRDDDCNKNSKKEDRSKNKEGKQYEEENRAVDKRTKKGRNTNNKERQNDSSDEEELEHRQKERKNKNYRKDIEKKSSETEERREGKEKKSNKSNVSEDKKKATSKENKKDKRKMQSSSSESSSSSSSSSDTSSSSESENENTGGRYWDSFDIEPITTNKDKYENNKTPEIKQKKYDKRRER